MTTVLYHMVSSSALVSLGLYNLISTTRNYLKFPHTYAAKLFHPFPFPTTTLRHVPIYLTLLSLFLSIIHQLILSFYPDPLLKGHTPVHRLTSLHFATLLFLFLLLSLLILFSDSLSFDNSLLFALSSALFALHSNASSTASALQTSALEAHCLLVSARLSAIISFLCLILAAMPKLFSADAALSASLILRGLWTFQTGLSLHADAFIPEGCHRLLDVVNGVEGSTQCDLDESKLRAVALLDLAFLLQVVVVVVVVFATYAIVAKSVGARRLGSYEALPTNSNSGDANHQSVVQMKAMAGTQA
ncbi:hypothetical protein HN51_041275 [Arachis hypogaea]|uniref:uncharacterized protein n=1 Tax=Arachis hypogaea TaxID=3818 RepID=UPI000DED0620|nr:uncharacterized protein LOC112754952 [Arachis hypogaea]QHN87005.1 uncharacterized protein DS421_16g551230 [Arachis hypogaea]